MSFPLDTSAQLRKPTATKSQKKLQKRARRVNYKQQHVERLKALDSPLHKMYVRADFCSTEIVHEGQNLKTKYCNARCCPVCNSIRTAKMINGYGPSLDKMKDPQFVTLTYGQRVPANQVATRLGEMTKAFRRTLDRMRKQGIKANGIRKTEITARATDNTFHVHFHLVAEGLDVSRMILSNWLKSAPEASKKGQDIRPYDRRHAELFKYVTKQELEGMSAKNLDTIYQATYGKRTFQPFGIIRKISEDIETESTDIVDWIEPAEVATLYVWIQEAHDWIDLMTGQCLSGYNPEHDPPPKTKKAKRPLHPPTLLN